MRQEHWTIPLNEALIKELIKQHYGSIDELAVEWDARIATGQLKLGQARDRSTIYRWMKTGIPSKRDDLFGLASLLDVDPLALISLSKDTFQQIFPGERLAFGHRLANASRLAAIWPMFMPGPNWPDDELAKGFFKRPWFTAQHMYDPSIISNIYAAFHIHQSCADRDGKPMACHFAYRRTGALDRMWRPYGSIVGFDGSVRLVAESGHFQEIADQRSPKLIAVETFFGTGPAEFKLSSLHDFRLSVKAPSTETTAVRFPG